MTSPPTPCLQDKQVVLQLAVGLLYYLTVMCVAKYQTILNTAGGRVEEGDLETTSSVQSGGGITAKAVIPLSVSRKAPKAEGSGKSEGKMSNVVVDVEQSLMPSTLSTSQAVDVSEQVEVSLKLIGSFLCRLLMDSSGESSCHF